MKSDNIDRDGENPSSPQWGKGIEFVDKNGERVGSFSAIHETDGTTRTSLYTFNEDGNGNEQSNALSMYVTKDGTKTYWLSSPFAFRQALTSGTANANAKFFRGDGELTNVLINKSFETQYDYFDLSQSNNGVSSTRWPSALNTLDKDGRAASFFGSTINSDGNVGASIYSYNVVNGATKSNSFTVWVEKDGSLKYSYASPSAARDSLAMNTWTSVTAANWISLASGWSFDAFETYVNVALKKVVIRAHIKTTTARSVSNISLGTIKESYRPKGRSSIPPTAPGKDCTFFFDNSGAAYIGIGVSLAANAALYFAGEYSLA